MEQLRNKLNRWLRLTTLIIIIFLNSCSGPKFAQSSTSIDEAMANRKRINILVVRNDNRYSSFPEKIYKLRILEELSFTGSDCDNLNQNCKNIEELPNGIKRLSNLKKLSLVMNNIKFVTKEINELKNLIYLDLSNNPSLSIDNFNNPNLEILNLNGCNLNKLPKNLNKMKKLKIVGLEGNNINESEIEFFKKKFPNCKVYW